MGGLLLHDYDVDFGFHGADHYDAITLDLALTACTECKLHYLRHDDCGGRTGCAQSFGGSSRDCEAAAQIRRHKPQVLTQKYIPSRMIIYSI